MGIETDLKRIADALEAIADNSKPMIATSAELDTPKKKSTKAVTEEVPAAPAPETPAPAAKVSEQQLREALRQLIVRHETKGKGKGMEEATAIIVKFGAKTVGAIKPTDYAAIVALCDADKKKYDAAPAKTK